MSSSPQSFMRCAWRKSILHKDGIWRGALMALSKQYSHPASSTVNSTFDTYLLMWGQKTRITKRVLLLPGGLFTRVVLQTSAPQKTPNHRRMMNWDIINISTHAEWHGSFVTAGQPYLAEKKTCMEKHLMPLVTEIRHPWRVRVASEV